METEEHEETPQAIEEEEGSEGVERKMEETTKDATLNIEGDVEPDEGLQVGEQQARKQEHREELSAGAAGEDAHAQGQDAWETRQGEKEEGKGEEENLGRGGGSDEQEEEGRKEGSSESPVIQDDSSVETTAGERQLETESYVGGAVQQSEDDKDEGALPTQTTEHAALSGESVHDETVTDHEVVPQQQQDDEQRIASKNEGEETAESTAELPLEEQMKTVLEQTIEQEQSKQEEGRQQEDARQENEATNMHVEATVREKVNQETQDKQKQKEDAEREWTVLETKEEHPEGRENHMLAEQQPQSEGEATPDKEKEGGEASLREAKVDEGQLGKEDPASQREELDNTLEDAAAEHKKGKGEQTVREAPPDREQARIEKKSKGVSKRHQREAEGKRQHRPDGIMQEFKKLISSLDSLAKRFEDQRTQLHQKHLAGQMEKQEQLLHENESLVRRLLERQRKLLAHWKDHWERMLEGGNGHAGFMRGAAVRSGPSREQVMQHQHTEKLTHAFAEAAKRFGETIRQVNECCSTFVHDHERALQVIYEYRRAIDLLEMGVRMNGLPKKELHERLRACSEAFSVLSQLLITFDKRVTSLLGLTGALEAAQALSLAHLKQVLEAQEQKQAELAAVDETAGVVVLKGKTAGVTDAVEGETISRGRKRSTEEVRKRQQPRADPRLTALQNEQKQLLRLGRRAVRSLEKLSRSVAKTARSVVNARSLWMQELSTQLLRHFDFLLRAGKQLHSREQQRKQRRKSREKGQRRGGRRVRQTPSESDELDARTRDDERRQRKKRWESPRSAGTSMYPRRKRQKLPEKDGAYDDMEDEEKRREGHLESESNVDLQRLSDGTQRKGTPLMGSKLADAFRRQAEHFAGQGIGRGETQLLDDVNLAGWKAIQEMAEGARATSQIARDTREALEKEIQTDPTTVALGALLGVVLLFLLALVIYGYHMVFSYEEQINAYKLGNRAGQAVEKDETKVTAENRRSVVGNIGKRFG